MEYENYDETQETLSESELSDSFIATDDSNSEDGLNWDSEESRPAGPSPPSTPRTVHSSLMSNSPVDAGSRNYQRRLRPRRRQAPTIPPDTESQSDIEPDLVLTQPLQEPAEEIVDVPSDSDATDLSNDGTRMLPLEYEPVNEFVPDYPPPADPPPADPSLVDPSEQPAVYNIHDPGPQQASPSRPTTTSTNVAGQGLNSTVLSESDEGSLCTICMDPLTNSGAHRVVCLRCGHIFGQSCVERWIKVGCNNGARRCPTCNKKACLKDIRILFFSKVVPLDTVEKDRLIQEKETMSCQKKAMEMELNRCKLQCEMNRKRYEKKISELEQQCASALETIERMNQGQGRGLAGGGVLMAEQPKGVSAALFHAVELSKDGGCRVMSYSPMSMKLAVSQPSGNTIFAGFGVRLLNTIDFQPAHFVFLHQKMIRDLAFHPEERSILLSVSLDQTAKLVDLDSKCTIHTFKNDGPLWSCCWDASNPHLLLVGTQMGRVFQYDRRMVDTHVNVWEDRVTTPVVALSSVPSMPNSPFPQGGFFSCRLNSVFAYARSSETYKMQELPLEGPFMSMKYMSSSQTLLTKTRPSSRCQYSMINMHLVDRDRQNNICLPQIHAFNCGSYANSLTRFTTLPYDGDMLVVGHHQSSRTVNLWSTKTGDLQYSLPAKEPVIDIETVGLSDNKCLIATLSEKKVCVYKVT